MTATLNTAKLEEIEYFYLTLMIKVLITGAAGFIGSNLTKKLLGQGYSVIGLDNFNDYYNPKFKEQNIAPFLDSSNFKLIRADITNKKELDKVFRKERPKKVVHLAARAGVRPSIDDPLLYEKVNIKGTLNLLENCKKNIDQLVFASSSSVYGGSKKIPFSEDQNVNRPISPYASTKLAGEALAFNYHHLYNLPVTCLRFFTVYGPRGRPDMAPYLFTSWVAQDKEIKMFGDGSSKRDYTYIDDITKGISQALEKELDFGIINLGNSQTVKLIDFINLIGKLMEKKPKIKQMPEQPGDVPLTYADITKAKKLLNYEPKTNFEEGMKKFTNWFKENRL